jgi:hypothetical protein
MIESKAVSDFVVFLVSPILGATIGYVAGEAFFPENNFAPLSGSVLGLIVSGVGMAGYVKYTDT